MRDLTHREITELFNAGKLHNAHPPRSFALIKNNEVRSSTVAAYFDNNKLHRIGAPAFVRHTQYGRIEEYWENGRLHSYDDWAVVRFGHDNSIISAEKWINGNRIYVKVDGINYTATTERQAP